jgi:hypothetical protein
MNGVPGDTNRRRSTRRRPGVRWRRSPSCRRKRGADAFLCGRSRLREEQRRRERRPPTRVARGGTARSICFGAVVPNLFFWRMCTVRGKAGRVRLQRIFGRDEFLLFATALYEQLREHLGISLAKILIWLVCKIK